MVCPKINKENIVWPTGVRIGLRRYRIAEMFGLRFVLVMCTGEAKCDFSTSAISFDILNLKTGRGRLMHIGTVHEMLTIYWNRAFCQVQSSGHTTPSSHSHWSSTIRTIKTIRFGYVLSGTYQSHFESANFTLTSDWYPYLLGNCWPMIHTSFVPSEDPVG